MYAKVIIEYSVKKLDREFIYKVPYEFQNKIKPGMKVQVEFGHQQITGFVLEILDNVEQNAYEIKFIQSLLDENFILNKELLDVGKYLSQSTLCTLISAYQTMLPSGLKVKSQKHNYDLYDEFIVLCNTSRALDYKAKFSQKRKAQIKVIDDLLKKTRLNKKDYSKGVIDSLIENDIIKIIKEKKYRINKSGNNISSTLTKEQELVKNSVLESMNSYETFLLNGVTGSGKTEVYIKIIEEIIKQGKTAIVLVPEISLTTQISQRFYNTFGSDVAILHSSLSNGEKYDEYLKIYRGEVHIVVGTRSAIFAPLKNLGIIIIDEEDASSYKQDNNPRYHAKDIAIFRCKYNNIPLLLGSATPSLESKARADKNVFKELTLKNRVGASILPKIHLVDMEEEMKKRNVIISDLLKRKIEEKLSRHEQIILLLNRRGFSTYITCSNCGYTFKCPSCDITLTYHKSTNNLICHYCGYQEKKGETCPNCHKDALNYYGLGTEKLEEKLQEMFKETKIIRMDQDTTRNKGTHEKILEDFRNEKYDILLGTQMISKGLDFPKVTLVGVINADTTLNIPSFKSSENTFSLLSQVAGRSGRSDLLGEVIIQTFNPDNYVIKCVKENDYNKFYHYEMNFRHKLKYPPYYYLVSLKVIGKDYQKTIDESKKVKKYLDKNLTSDFIVLGPTTASVFKFNSEYRMQIIIKYQKENNLREILKDLINLYTYNNDNYLEIDFNPLNI